MVNMTPKLQEIKTVIKEAVNTEAAILRCSVKRML